MKEVLVIVAADPRQSERPLEALRMCVGLALGANRVRVILENGAEALLTPEKHAFPDWPRANEYLAALRELGGEIGTGGGPVAAAEGAGAVIRWGP